MGLLEAHAKLSQHERVIYAVLVQGAFLEFYTVDSKNKMYIHNHHARKVEIPHTMLAAHIKINDQFNHKHHLEVLVPLDEAFLSPDI